MDYALIPSTATAALPVNYERAKAALAECSRIDECQDWANKAEALASYAKQADDDTLRKLADRIQARAVRRCGELLKTFQQPKGDRKSEEYQTVAADGLISQRRAARDAGMSERQELTAVRVSNVPVDQFEALVESDHPPTVTKLAELGKTSKPAPPGFINATRTIGIVREFAQFCRTHDPEQIAGAVYDYEVRAIRDDVATVDSWLDRFVVNLRGVPSV